MIPPLIPPQAPLEQLIRGTLPGPPEPTPVPDDDILYGVWDCPEFGIRGQFVNRGVEFAALERFVPTQI